MLKPTEKTSELSLGENDLDDIQTLKNLLELHADLKRGASSLNKRLD